MDAECVKPSASNEVPFRTATKADLEGRFLLENVRPGTVRLWAQTKGYARTCGESMRIGPGEVIDGVRLRLSQGGRLSGTVLDSKRSPASGAQVCLGGRGQGRSEYAVADDKGRFSMDHLTPGTYLAFVLPTRDVGEADASQSAENAESVEIREGETTHIVLRGPRR